MGAAEPPRRNGMRCLVDGHVHIHPGAAPGESLDAAARNMAAAVRALGPTDGPTDGVLLLAEVSGVDAFAALPEEIGGWRVGTTAEPVSRLARRQLDGARLAIVAGRQIVTSENLEILALGTRRAIADGAPMAETIAEIAAEGGGGENGPLAVLPWGVGKWTGRRGGIVRGLIDAASGPPFFLADSGVRLAGSPRPALLAAGEARGRLVLAGSDPLPLAGERRKTGRYGFVVEAALDPDAPFAALARWLRARRASPAVYGRLERPLAFFGRQIAMQVRGRAGRAGRAGPAGGAG